jgi:hypothetical protein
MALAELVPLSICLALITGIVGAFTAHFASVANKNGDRTTLQSANHRLSPKSIAHLDQVTDDYDSEADSYTIAMWICFALCAGSIVFAMMFAPAAP